MKLHTKSLDSPLAAFIGYIGTLPLLYGLMLFTAYRLRVLARRDHASETRAGRSLISS